MTAGPSVVLLSSNAAELERWSELLVGTAAVRSVPSVQALADALAGEAADVLVAPCDARLLEGIQRCRGEARLILLGSTLPLGVIDAAGQGYDLRHVDRESKLSREVHALARPRSLMVRHHLPGLAVRWDGGRRPAPVANVSNGGFSLRLELDEELERLLPGAVVEGVEIHRGSELALSAESAVVRYVEQVEEAGQAPHYRIGCEFSSSVAPPPKGRAMRVTDGAMRAGLLRAALRGGGILLQGQDGTPGGVLAPGGHVDLQRAEVVLEAQLVPFEPHDVVRCTFELGGGSYSFLTSVISARPFTIRLPRAIDAAQRRGSARYAPDPEHHPISVEIEAPLLPGGLLSRPVLEISSTGFSFAMDPAVDLFPPGMRLLHIRLHLGELTLACRGSVRNLNPIAGKPNLLRCGVVLDELDPSERARLADGVMRHRYPGLVDARALSFEEIWGFFKDTRFLYPEKLAALRPFFPEVRRTFLALQGPSDRVFKSLVYREQGGGPLGHLSCVRTYRRTWMIQHLAGSTRTRGQQVPQIVNTGLAEWVGQNTDADYAKVYFRPDNKWPARVFGGFARKLSDRNLSDLRTFEYRALPTDCSVPQPAGASEIEVVAASGSALALVERYFVAAENGLLLRSDDLTRSSLELPELGRAYEDLGLVRRRTVLLALRKDEPVGFALCEVSSPGINLSELLSALRLYVLPSPGMDPAESTALQETVRASLLAAALGQYRAQGRSFAVALLPEGDTSMDGLPALSRKQYTCWTVHSVMYRRFCEHLERLYERLGRARKPDPEAEVEFLGKTA
jgi:hypothetical protein